MKTSLSASVLCVALTTALALPPAAPAAAPPAEGDALVVYSAGLDQLMPSPKDRGLLQMLSRFDRTVLSLAERAGEMPPAPPDVVHFVFDLLTGPLALRAAMLDPQAEAAPGGPPISAQIDFMTPDLASAQQRSAELAKLLEQMGGLAFAPAPGDPLSRVADIDGAALKLLTSDQGGRFATTALINCANPSPFSLGQHDLPQGVQPAFAATFDARRVQPLLEGLFAMGGPEADMVRGQLEMAGLLGPNALSYNMALGYSGDRGYLAARSVNYRHSIEAMGGRSDARVTRQALARVPADATYAQVSAFHPQNYLKMFERAAGAAPAPAPDIRAALREILGIDIEADLLAHLGSVFGVYTSESGGGGLMSLVAFAEVSDDAALRRTIARLAERVNEQGRLRAEGLVQVIAQREGDVEMSVLCFPGLPVPVQPAVALDRGCLYAALNVGALQAALRHARKGGAGLLDNPRLASRKLDLEGAIQLGFIDTPRLMQGGYGLISLGINALSNASRAPGAAEMAAGALPPYSDLLEGAQPIVQVVRVQGDDLVSIAEVDRSLLVNACGVAGAVGGAAGALAIGGAWAGITMPALGRARGGAHEGKSAVQLRQIAMAVHMYASDHHDKTPPSFDALVEAQYIDWSLLASPFGPLGAGRDFWLDTRGLALSRVESPERTILAYDRAQYAAGGNVNVVFYDSHREVLTREQFEALLKEPQHRGIDFDLP